MENLVEILTHKINDSFIAYYHDCNNNEYDHVGLLTEKGAVLFQYDFCERENEVVEKWDISETFNLGFKIISEQEFFKLKNLHQSNSVTLDEKLYLKENNFSKKINIINASKFISLEIINNPLIMATHKNKCLAYIINYLYGEEEYYLIIHVSLSTPSKIGANYVNSIEKYRIVSKLYYECFCYGVEEKNFEEAYECFLKNSITR